MEDQMKIISFTCCHYGSDYLGWAIKSVYDHVDECWVVYSDKPSHGHGTTLTNPDSKQAVKDSLYHFGDPDNKIKWKEGNYQHEGHHRIQSVEIAKERKAELIVVVDADEVWQPEGLELAISSAKEHPARNSKLRMIHFWRNFNWICRDQMMPDRIIKVGGDNKCFNYVGNSHSPILHFGYARKLIDCCYKISIHGHKGEWRNDWYNKFKNWRPGCGMQDLHPTCTNIWTPEPYDKSTMPVYMKTHPWYNSNLIE